LSQNDAAPSGVQFFSFPSTDDSGTHSIFFEKNVENLEKLHINPENLNLYGVSEAEMKAKGQKKDLAATYSPALLQYHRRESA
jgi:hypothetical protein